MTVLLPEINSRTGYWSWSSPVEKQVNGFSRVVLADPLPFFQNHVSISCLFISLKNLVIWNMTYFRPNKYDSIVPQSKIGKVDIRQTEAKLGKRYGKKGQVGYVLKLKSEKG